METTENVRTPGRGRRALARVGVMFGTVGAVIAGTVAAASATTSALPNPGSVATTLATTAGSQLANTAVTVLPVIIGVLVLFWAINYVMGKFGFGRKAKVH